MVCTVVLSYHTVTQSDLTLLLIHIHTDSEAVILLTRITADDYTKPLTTMEVAICY